MDTLSVKTLEHFRGKVVRKDLTNLMKRGANVPTYVLEYLLGMYCATDDESAIAVGIKKIEKVLMENYVRQGETEKIKFLIREKGEYTIIDKISATLDEYHDCYSGLLTNLAIGHFVLPEEYVKKYTKILMGGIWCMIKIAYRHNEDFEEENRGRKAKKDNPWDSPFQVKGIKPIQMPNLNIDDILEKRQYFTTEEWITLILRSCGIEPAKLNEKEKYHYLERLVPLVERNYNLCELGPRGTGKSHLYKEISPYSILMSGGQTSTSNMFYNLRTRSVGLVGNWDCVAFDEVAGMNFHDKDAIQIMKDYMASGSFARGKDQVNADASIVFVGNTNDTVENMLKVSHLFEPFPPEFNNDSAFFDRIHYYLPGWEVPKMRSDYITEEYGLITDCLAEFTREMRKLDYSHMLDSMFKLNSCVTTRDEIAIRKTVSGLLKLIFPDKNYTNDDAEKILTYAIEGRRRVKEQLRKMAGDEFADTALGYLTSEKSIVVNVPEDIDESLIPNDALEPGHLYAIGASVYDDKPAVFKLENKTIRGNGKLEIQGIKGYGAAAKQVRESLNAAWKYYLDNGKKVAPIERMLDRDYLVYVEDTQNRLMSSEISVAEFIGLCSVSQNQSTIARLAVVGELTLSGTIKDVKNLEDYIRVAVNAGATRILLPAMCENDFRKLKDSDLIGIIPLYYDTPLEAAKIALEYI